VNNWFNNLGNNSKFDTLVKLAFYSLFLFVAIILINTSDINVGDDNLSDDNDTNEQEQRKELLELTDNYTYKYSITVDDKIYSYHGIYSDNIYEFKKNKDNVISEYKYENNNYYVLEKKEYKIIESDKVFDIIDYMYLDIERIKQYLNNSKYKDSKYYMYLKDEITGLETDVYILMELTENKITVDYSKLKDDYETLIVVFEYEERIEGEINEG